MRRSTFVLFVVVCLFVFFAVSFDHLRSLYVVGLSFSTARGRGAAVLLVSVYIRFFWNDILGWRLAKRNAVPSSFPPLS